MIVVKTTPTLPPASTIHSSTTKLPKNLLIKVQCDSKEHCTTHDSTHSNSRFNPDIPIEIYKNGELHEKRVCPHDWRNWLEGTLVQYYKESGIAYPQLEAFITSCPNIMERDKATKESQATTTQAPIRAKSTTTTPTKNDMSTKAATNIAATNTEGDNSLPKSVADKTGSSIPSYVWAIVSAIGGVIVIVIGGSIIMCKKYNLLCWNPNGQTKTHKNEKYKPTPSEQNHSNGSDNSSSSLKTTNNQYSSIIIEGNKVSNKIELPYYPNTNYVIIDNVTAQITLLPPAAPSRWSYGSNSSIFKSLTTLFDSEDNSASQKPLYPNAASSSAPVELATKKTVSFHPYVNIKQFYPHQNGSKEIDSNAKDRSILPLPPDPPTQHPPKPPIGPKKDNASAANKYSGTKSTLGKATPPPHDSIKNQASTSAGHTLCSDEDHNMLPQQLTHACSITTLGSSNTFNPLDTTTCSLINYPPTAPMLRKYVKKVQSSAPVIKNDEKEQNAAAPGSLTKDSQEIHYDAPSSSRWVYKDSNADEEDTAHNRVKLVGAASYNEDDSS